MDKIVITGGHHSSALPVIQKIKSECPDTNIFWYGHKYSVAKDRNPTLEYHEITSLRLPFFEIKAGKFYKTYNILRLLKIPYGFFQSLVLLCKHKPDVILSFGGYIAAPVVVAGWVLGIPAITHEQTVVIGYANKIISKFVKKILLTWPDSEKYFPKGKTVLTGLPLREEIFNIQSDKYLSETNLPTLYITGGKTGSHIINEFVYENLEELLYLYDVIHQIGDHSEHKDYERLEKKYSEIKNKAKGRYFPERFVFAENIGEAYAKADVVIARAGAHTCYEVIALEKPTIFIPIPWVSHNEQHKNAVMVKELGLAEVLEQDRLSLGKFTYKVRKILDKRSEYKLKKDVLVKNSSELILNETKSACKKKKN